METSSEKIVNDPGSRSAASPSPSSVCVVGAGYVGLTSAACLAELGHRVRCLEADPGRLATLTAGRTPIYEPGLDELLARGLRSGRLSFTDQVTEALTEAAVVLLCVGTPPRPDGDPDLRQLGLAARQIAAAAPRDLVIAVKSTVPPGACEALELYCADTAPAGITVAVASNPEFLREGHAVEDFLAPDRVVIGAEDQAIAMLVRRLLPSDAPVVFCDRRSAELVKYAANTFLAVKVSFANEVAGLCERLGAQAATVLRGVGLDQRIGERFLDPGPGFGGSCLPKDLSGFIAVADAVGHQTPIARAAQEVNAGARHAVIEKLEHALGCLGGTRIAVLGLAFKAGTDDTRDSPGVSIVEALVNAGAAVTAYDPIAHVDELPARVASDPYAAVLGADAAVLVTAAPELAGLNPQRLRRRMAGRVLVDAAGVLDQASAQAADLDIYGVGAGMPTSFHPVVWRPLQWIIPSPQSTGSIPAKGRLSYVDGDLQGSSLECYPDPDTRSRNTNVTSTSPDIRLAEATAGEP